MPAQPVRTRSLALVAAICMAAATAACSSSGSGASATTAGSTTTPATVAPASAAPPASAPAATTGAGTGQPAVDLTFTGTFAFTAKGTAGRCVMAGGLFGFEGTEADYPGLGVSYSMGVFGGNVDVKWVKDDDNSWGNNPSSTITLTPDHHGISIDQDLAPFTNMSTGKTAGPEHVKGTITCP